jgi:hypothetical protein
LTEKVRIEVEFESPGGQSLEECCKLVMLQMRAKPNWPDGEDVGTGHLNYVCHDRSLRIVSAKIEGSA